MRLPSVLLTTQTLWVLLADVGTVLLRLGLAVALVRHLSPAGFGQYVYVMAVAGLAECLALPGLDRALQRAVVVGSSGSIPEAVRLKRRHAVLGALAMAGAGLWHAMRGDAVLAGALFTTAVWFIPDQVADLTRAVLIGRQQFARLCGVTLVEQGMAVAATVLVIMHTQTLWVLMHVMMGVSVAVRMAWFLRLRLAQAAGPSEAHLLSDSRQMTAMTAMGMAVSHAVKLVIAHALSFSELAVYGMASLVVERLRRLMGFIFVGLMPRFAQHTRDGAQVLARALMPSMALGFGALAGFLALAAPWGIPWLFGRAYASAVPYVQWLALGLFFDLLSSVLTKAWMPAQRNWAALWRSTLLQAAGQLALYAFCIPRWGLAGAVMVSVAVAAAHFLYIYIAWLVGSPAAAATPNGRIRLCHLISRLEPGGAEHQVASLLRGLDPARYERTIVYFEGRGSLAASLREHGARVVSLPMRFRWDLRVAWPLRRFLRAHPQDLVHTHGLKAQVLGALTAKRAGVPVLVSTEHNEEAYLRRPLGRALHRWAMRRHDALIAISDAVAAYVRRQRTISGTPVERIYYGLDVPARAPEGAQRNGYGPGPVIGSIGRLVAQKGHDHLLIAAAELLPEYPDLRVVIAGHGPWRSRLERLAARLGLQGRVEFLGFRADLPELMRAWDVAVFPSRWEGLGVAIMEAMALGKPVVASAVGGIPELIEHGRHGWLAPPGDPPRLADAIRTALTADADAIGREARQRILSAFSPRAAVTAHERLYARLLATRRRIRLAMVAESIEKNGPRVSLMTLARHLQADGRFQVTVICSTRRDPSFADELKHLEEIGVCAIRLDLYREIHPPADAAAWLRLWRHLRHGRFDIVQTFSSKAGFLGRLAALAAGVPVIVHMPHCYAFTHTDIPAWQRRLFVWLEWLSARWTTMSVAVSESQRVDAISRGIVPAERIMTIPNGVDLQRFYCAGVDIPQKRRELGLPDDRPLIGTVGVLETSKNHGDLLRAVARLKAQGRRVHLAIAGQGKLRQELLRLAGDLGLNGDVSFLGYRHDVRDLLAVMDLYVLSSRWEGMSYAMLEAMAMERPVVSTTVHGAVDLIESGTNGLLTAPGDPDALSRTIEQLLADPAIAKQYGRRARLAVQTSCRLECQLDQLTRLYLTLCPAWPADRETGFDAPPAPSYTEGHSLVVHHSPLTAQHS